MRRGKTVLKFYIAPTTWLDGNSDPLIFIFVFKETIGWNRKRNEIKLNIMLIQNYNTNSPSLNLSITQRAHDPYSSRNWQYIRSYLSVVSLIDPRRVTFRRSKTIFPNWPGPVNEITSIEPVI